MAYIHSKGIAHLDLKTSNILLTADKRSTVIADFGISQTRVVAGSDHGSTSSNPVFDSGRSVEMAALGGGGGGGGGDGGGGSLTFGSGATLALTPHYCAPERLFSDFLSFDQLQASDVYSYGAGAVRSGLIELGVVLREKHARRFRCSQFHHHFSSSHYVTLYVGVVVWVIYAQVEPFAGLSGDDVIAAIKADPDTRHVIPVWTDFVVRGVIERCWESTRRGPRPAFGDIFDVLQPRFCSDEIGGKPEDVYRM